MRASVSKLGIVLAVIVALAVGGAAWATSGDDGDTSVTGPAADRAKAAALAHVDGGTATAVERESEHGASWEVEVRRDDGSHVDVLLDERYVVILVEDDSDEVEDDSDDAETDE
jgi:outer membrane lipoprotein SlyB